MISSAYCCPHSGEKLQETDDGLVGVDGARYPYLDSQSGFKIPVFIDAEMLSDGDAVSRAMYARDDSESFYENFLAWLFATFEQDETEFRNSLIDKLNLSSGDRVLVTGVGLGDDLHGIIPRVGATGAVFAQDLSDMMIAATCRRFLQTDEKADAIDNLFLSVSNASILPHTDDFFDAAYHFGGINLFSDIEASILEMARVVKPGGKVVIGDEGVAPWLREHEYGKMTICNNALWASEPPLALLPETATDVHLSWVLGNCFYVIDFEVSESLPNINIDVPHKGARGGSIRTRYFGQIEGVDPKLREEAIRAAADSGLSLSAWMGRAISGALKEGKKTG